jgi:hypothetical protein
MLSFVLRFHSDSRARRSRHDTPISISVAKATFFTGKREEGALKPSELANILAYSKAVRAIVLDKGRLRPSVLPTRSINS